MPYHVMKFAGNALQKFSIALSYSLIVLAGADLGGGPGGLGPPTPHFEAQIFAAAETPLCDVGKISAGPPLTQILDPHLSRYYPII